MTTWFKRIIISYNTLVAMCQKRISGVKVKGEAHEVVTELVVPETNPPRTTFRANFVLLGA